MEIAELKEYIDSSIDNMQKLADADEEEQQLLLYETYANFLDMITDSKQILRELRTKFKIRETEVKKWMAENEEEEEGEEEGEEEQIGAKSTRTSSLDDKCNLSKNDLNEVENEQVEQQQEQRQDNVAALEPVVQEEVNVTTRDYSPNGHIKPKKVKQVNGSQSSNKVEKKKIEFSKPKGK
jgi:hypothetical protein